MYQLVYHPQATKNFKQLHPNDQKKILKKLETLAENPQNTTLNIKKLTNTKNNFRIRAGNIRAIYEIDNENKIIYIWDIDYRGTIY